MTPTKPVPKAPAPPPECRRMSVTPVAAGSGASCQRPIETVSPATSKMRNAAGQRSALANRDRIEQYVVGLMEGGAPER